MRDAGVLLDLTRRYCEPHRRYHTIEHIADMFWRGRELDLSEAQVFAIWYHDAVYAVPSSTNEEDSAALAVAQLSAAGYDAAFVRRVETIVLDTKRHRPSIEESRDVIDLDLSSLASDRARFTQNTANIRLEYGCYSDAEFREGQRRVFEDFLARDRIFCSDWAAPLEAVARRNLKHAIEALG